MPFLTLMIIGAAAGVPGHAHHAAEHRRADDSCDRCFRRADRRVGTARPDDDAGRGDGFRGRADRRAAADLAVEDLRAALGLGCLASLRARSLSRTSASPQRICPCQVAKKESAPPPGPCRRRPCRHLQGGGRSRPRPRSATRGGGSCLGIVAANEQKLGHFAPHGSSAFSRPWGPLSAASAAWAAVRGPGRPSRPVQRCAAGRRPCRTAGPGSRPQVGRRARPIRRTRPGRPLRCEGGGRWQAPRDRKGFRSGHGGRMAERMFGFKPASAAALGVSRARGPCAVDRQPPAQAQAARPQGSVTAAQAARAARSGAPRARARTAVPARRRRAR